MILDISKVPLVTPEKYEMRSNVDMCSHGVCDTSALKSFNFVNTVCGICLQFYYVVWLLVVA